MRAEKRVGPVAVAGLLALLAAPVLRGQAWIAPRGETTVALTFQRTEFQGHLYSDGSRIPHGGSHSRTLSLGIEHSLTDRLAISASIPYVGSANGIDPEPVLGFTGIDDRKFHETWQDFRFGARYNIVSHPLMVTPTLVFRIPSHHYPTIGEAAVGAHLREAQLGIDVGRTFGTAFYVDGQYSYALAEKFEGLSTNRSNIDAEVGYFPLPPLNVRALVSWQDTYGGLTAGQIFSAAGPPFRNPNLSDDLWFSHDRLVRDDYWRAGLGATYAVTPRVGVSGTLVRVLSGSNSHYGYFYAISVSRTFGAR